MAAEQHTHDHVHAEEHGETMTKSKIWQVFFILLAVTAVEFIIALYFIPKGFMNQGIGNFLYIVLTLVKAFYIVAYFMHLKYERFAMRTSVIITLVFLVYFIVLLLTEGSYLHVHMN